MNLYRGCCHGCIYCDSRSSCYRIEDFNSVAAKADAIRILLEDLQRKSKPPFIGMGSMSDPYNPFEEQEHLTRDALTLINFFRCGVTIATKSDLIARDIRILQQIQAHSPVICKITITTTDDALASRIEPHAPSPTRRLAALKKLSEAGLFCGVLLMPVLPFLEDLWENVRSVVESAARAGARFVYAAFGVSMRDGQREYFLRELDRLFPGQDLSRRYLQQYGLQYQCVSPRARNLWDQFSRLCRDLGLFYEMEDIIPAATSRYRDDQLSLF